MLTKINPNMQIYHDDIGDFNKLITSENREINLFCSFTYITPNYSILFTLNELKKFVENKNYKIFIVIWDMNTFANPYFKRLCSSRKISNPTSYIDNKIKELKGIMLSMGFNSNQTAIYKSSDIWKRMISYKDEDLFYQFYDVLSQMNIDESLYEQRISHLFQIPIDLFFCNYFHKLYPEDTDHEIDMAFLGSNKEVLYKTTRKLMLKEGLIGFKKPLFAMLKKFPYLINNYVMPEWNMSKQSIKELLISCNLSSEDISCLLDYLGEDIPEIHKINKKKITLILSDILYSYLQKHKKSFETYSGESIETEMINISKKEEIKKIGEFLKSNIALEILLLSNGNMTVTQIAKALSKSVATISIYAKKLRKSGFIKTSSDGKIKRTIKGIKINFEFDPSK